MQEIGASMLDHRVKTFLTVCDTRNYTRAAEKLNLTQPAVTQHIAWLERAYGAKLFEYRHRKLELTDAGKELYRGLSVMAHDERLLRERVAQASQGTALPLRVGLTLTAGAYLVGVPLARFLAGEPGLDVTVRSGDTAALLALLESGAIDCAFVEGGFDARRFKGSRFCTERFIGVAAADHVFARPPERLADLLDETLIVREKGSGSRNVLENVLAGEHLGTRDFAHACVVESLEVIAAFVAQDLGISFLYEAAVRDRLEKGTLQRIPLAGGPIMHDISFVRLPGSAFEPQLMRVFDGVRNAREG